MIRTITCCLVLISLLLSGCRPKESPAPDLLPILQQFTADYAAAYEIELVESRVDGPAGNPRLILLYRVSHRWKLEQARLCIVDGAKTLMRRAGPSAQLTPDQIYITLAFTGQDPKVTPVTSISQAYLSEGIINYSAYESEGELKKIYRETFYEALKEVENGTANHPFRLDQGRDPRDLPLPTP